MAQDLFRNQVYQAKDYKGLITDTHLYSLFQQEPQLVDKIFRQISQMYLTRSAINFVNRFPVMEVEQENGFYQWMVKGQEQKNVPLKDAETLAGQSVSAGTFPSAVGANRERFYLCFDEPFFDNTDVIKIEGGEDYHFLVKRSFEEGGKYKYEVELLNDDVEIAAPASIFSLAAGGARAVKFYGRTPSTLSYEGSQPYFTSPFKLQNRASMCRMEYTVPGNMIQKGQNEPLLFPFMHQGKVIKVWTNYIEMMVKAQTDELEAMGALYGKKNWDKNKNYFNFDDKTKFEIGSGSGFFEQIAPGNQHKYNSFDIDHLCEMALDMSIGRIPRGEGGRHLHILTGERGAIEIHKSIDRKQATGKWSVQNTSHLLESALAIGSGNASNIGHSTPLKFGSQFTEYHYFNGVKVTVEILDFFDDDVMFPTRHPDGAGIAESHRMLVMGLGEDAGIKRVKIKGQDDVMGLIPGLRDPYSPGGKGRMKTMASKIDGYEVVCAKWGGLNLEDPTKVLDWQLNI